jgi:hypothetical protein
VKEFFPLRSFPGKSGNRKLLDDDVRTIRKMAADGIPASRIADNFPGVAVETIRKVARRETFRSVPDHPLNRPAAVTPTFMEEQMDLMRQAAARMRLEKDAGADANEILEEIEGGRDLSPAPPPGIVPPRNPLPAQQEAAPQVPPNPLEET